MSSIHGHDAHNVGSILGKEVSGLQTASKSNKKKKGKKTKAREHDAVKLIDSMTLTGSSRDKTGTSVTKNESGRLTDGVSVQSVTKSGNVITIYPSPGSCPAVFLKAIYEENPGRACSEITVRKGAGQPFEIFRTNAPVTLTTEVQSNHEQPNIVIIFSNGSSTDFIDEVDVQETEWVKWDNMSDEKQWIETRLNEERWMRHYDSSHKILVLEGDFSFSFRLSDGLTSAANMICAYPYSQEYALRSFNYYIFHSGPNYRRGCKVKYNADIRKMVDDVSYMRKFDRIVLNFDSDGFFKDLHGHDQFQAHRNLIDRIFGCASFMYSKLEGEIHIVYRKANDLVSRYNLQELASKKGLYLIEAVEVAYFDSTFVLLKFSSWKEKIKALSQIRENTAKDPCNVIPTAGCSFCSPKSSMI